MASCPDLAVINEKSLNKKSWKVIGKGGFGQVFKVRHLQRGDVAIKLLGLDDGSNSDKTLDRESELMRRAASPHVTQVLGVFRGRPPSVSGIQIGLVMELMERGSLASLQKKLNHPLPWSLVFRVAHQVAQGMNHLHGLNPPIIHKDLKPDNVLLDTDLNAKITDFGLSKFVDTATSARSKGAGTIKYMPPEALSLSYTSIPAFDVYSYGILLWFIVMGKEPYEDATNSLIELRIPMGDRPSLDVIKTEQTPGLKDLVELMERCWHKEPDKRPLFPECTAVTEALYERNKTGIEHAVYLVRTELAQKDIAEGVSMMDINQPPGPELRIVIIGKTGVGKSASGNTILGEKRFGSRASDRSVTEKCAKESIRLNNRMISVVDTPGFLDTHISQTDITNELLRCIQFSSPGPHVFLLALQVGRFTRKEKYAVEAWQMLFGPEADKYMMVLFTHGDDLEDGETIQQYVRGSDPALQQVIQRCGGRVHVFNNRSKDRNQVVELIQMIDYMVAANGGSCYTDEMYRLAEEVFQEVTPKRSDGCRVA